MILVDRNGVVSEDRKHKVNKYKAVFALDTKKKTLDDAMKLAEELSKTNTIGVAGQSANLWNHCNNTILATT